MEITVDQMYNIENKGHEMGFLKKFMMENAGAAATRYLVDAIPDISSKRVYIFAGSGNNGGDGLVVARHLAGYHVDTTVMMPAGYAAIKTQECRWNYDILSKMPSVRLSVDIPPDTPDILVDALLGTGITGTIREPYYTAIKYINDTPCFKLALDVPSGMDPQTGDTANIHTICDMTVTFHKMKQGIPKRPDLTGIVHVAKIGIPPEAEEGIL